VNPLLVSEILRRKRDGEELSEAEILHLVRGAADGSIPDYQISAWLMAAYLKGLTRRETTSLTRGVKESGEFFEWAKLSANFRDARFADKHSSGGVGDKVSLILAPLAACLGMKVPMMSGRSLGHTGGTVDKLESIPGFRMDPTREQMVEWLDRTGVFMTAQTAKLCPADRKLYHLRDVTATIESIPIITASIVSKKWAEGTQAIVFDVKCGEAAFMRSEAQARELGHSLAEVSSQAGLKARATITRMEEPLGAMIGNSLEVFETVAMLGGMPMSAEERRLSSPLLDLTIELTVDMAELSGMNKDQARRDVQRALADGSAWRKFEEMLANQGADARWLEKLPKAKCTKTLMAKRNGKIAAIHSRALGIEGVRIGVGRDKADGRVHAAAGFEMKVMPGDAVTKGQPLLVIHHDSESVVAACLARLESEANQIFLFVEDGHTPVDPARLVLERINA